MDPLLLALNCFDQTLTGSVIDVRVHEELAKNSLSVRGTLADEVNFALSQRCVEVALPQKDVNFALAQTDVKVALAQEVPSRLIGLYNITEEKRVALFHSFLTVYHYSPVFVADFALLGKLPVAAMVVFRAEFFLVSLEASMSETRICVRECLILLVFSGSAPSC